MNDLEKAREKWDSIDITKVRSVSWLSVPGIGAHAANSFTENGDIVKACHELLLKRGSPEEGLCGGALVCGDMVGEKSFFKSDYGVKFDKVFGFDLSPESLKRAVQNTSGSPFKFNPVKADCNKLDLAPQSFDFLIGLHGVHHIYELEDFFSVCAQALKPHGVLFLNEWIGPNYLQYPISNKIISTILLNACVWPLSRRRDHLGVFRTVCRQLPPEAFDPSEACNSKNLIKYLENHFNIIKRHDYGSLNYLIFEGLGQNFPSNPTFYTSTITLLSLKLEQILQNMRLVQPLFTYAMCVPIIQELI
jgi:SAM-dependent methyltransferase